MLLYIGEGSKNTVFDIIDLAQTHYKGHHFCALITRVEAGFLCFEPCEYRAPLHEEEIPSYVKFLSTPDESPCILEHFLQSVRKKFLGVSADFIRVESALNWQYVREVCA